ncbi:hypothetical protein [Mycoplana rhizolycopersici]|uniref:Uncharacterized protein n=1 Tax=Mycoplana rhizolycopersici TaxID=2746702 RepID=A0ABX2QJI0_9HYPH|nr:hypothetical protein [Rhizobium rhizolycopersici]NVP57506.1 hypothetical protein [Rhizobium rhizolycopersici]
MRMLTPFLIVAALVGAAPAFASSSDAWSEFRDDVKAKCVAALPEKLKNETVFVDEFGTEKYGVALISGRSDQEKARVTFACVYDKQSRSAQVTGAIGREYVRVLNDRQRAAVLERQKSNGATDESDESE